MKRQMSLKKCACSGWGNQELDAGLDRKRHLDAFIYNVGYIEGRTFQDHQEMIAFLRGEQIQC